MLPRSFRPMQNVRKFGHVAYAETSFNEISQCLPVSAICSLSTLSATSPSSQTRRLSSIVRKAAIASHQKDDTPLADYEDLRFRLGLCSYDTQPKRPSIFIAIDTETERLGLLDHVSEIGISILDTRDIQSTNPGKNGRNWFRKLQTKHWRVDHRNSVVKKRVRRDSCRFVQSQNLSPEQVQDSILQLLADIALPNTADLVLVGHTLDHDILALKSRPLFLRILETTKFARVFDTSVLAKDAVRAGAAFQSRSLGYLAPVFGVDPKHCRTDGDEKTLKGWHNSGNDAAYTLMLLVLFAIRWDDIIANGLRTTLIDRPLST